MITYQELLAQSLVEKFTPQLQSAQPGHCMKLSGVASDVLSLVLDRLREQFPQQDTYILAQEAEDGRQITATKLIELRNLEEKPLLVLIPSDLRTAAEDSFGSATFQELVVDGVEQHMEDQLLNQAPPRVKALLDDVLTYLRIEMSELPSVIPYLLELATHHFNPERLGLALYLLHLLPDQKLIEDPTQLKSRLNYNLQSVRILSSFQDSLYERISKLPIAKNTLQRDLQDFLKRERQLRRQREITQRVYDKYPTLWFEHWSIAELDQSQVLKVRILSDRSNPVYDIEEDGRVLNCPKNKPAKITLKFTTSPKPTTAPGLTHFRVDLMRPVGGGEFEYVLNLAYFKNSTARSSQRTKAIKLDPFTMENGVYFLRLTALNEDGIQLNVRDDFMDRSTQQLWEQEQEEKGETADYTRFKGKRVSDTENFEFVIDEEGEIEQEKERKEKIGSVLQAYFDISLSHLLKPDKATKLGEIEPDREEAWGWLGNKSSLQRTFHARFTDRIFNYQVILSHKLYEMERLILARPETVSYVSANVRHSHMLEKGALTLQKPIPTNLVPAEFMQARRTLFEVIREEIGDGEGVVETFGFWEHEDLVRTYITAYLRWMNDLGQKLKNLSVETAEEQQELKDLVYLLQNLDLVHLHSRFPNGEPLRAILFTPLHPLRMAWSLGLSELFSDWFARTEKALDDYRSYWQEGLTQLFTRELYPTANPLVLADHNGIQSLEYAGELTYGWGLYVLASSRVMDEETMSGRSQLILQYLQGLLNIQSNRFTEGDVSRADLVRHLKRYLRQHPYCSQLNLNLFNAGEARTFVEALIDLEKDPQYQHLRYEIRLFVDAERMVNHGQGFRELLNPETTQTEEAESFSQATRNRLFPKIRFSINRITEYLRDPDRYRSHLSFLVSPFPLEASVTRVQGRPLCFSLGGLLVEPKVEYESSGEQSQSVWRKYIYPNPSEQEYSYEPLIRGLFDQLQRIIARNMTFTATDSLPSLKLNLQDNDRVMLQKLHEYSDWVITFDRHLGPEMFDLPNRSEDLPYLLDYLPGEGVMDVSTFLTTRPTSEVTEMIRPHLGFLALSYENETRLMMDLLEDLRAMSSSIIMQLNSSEAMVREVVSLALTKRLLEEQEILKNQMVIPIELHLPLFAHQDPDSSGRRADLLLVSIGQNRNIHLQILEVKCRQGQALPASQSLQDYMQSQLDNTERVLRYHFDPKLYIHDRLDRPIKNRELARILLFYIQRASRYDLIDPNLAERYQNFLHSLDQGYQLTFSKMGLIFDFDADTGMSSTPENGQMHILHIGRRLIDQLLGLAEKDEISQDKIRTEFSRRLREQDLELSGWASQLLPNPSTVEEPEPYSEEKAPTPFSSPTWSDDEEEKAPEEASTSSESETLVFPILNTSPTLPEQPAQEPGTEHLGTAEPGAVAEKDEAKPPAFDHFVGDSRPSHQYGLLGATPNGKKFALDLSGTNTISLFGVQGAGKSYTIGTVTEMTLKEFPGINALGSPLAGVIFHYSESQDYEPEFTSMIYPNDDERQRAMLKAHYGAKPDRIEDVVLLVPQAKVEERRQEYPNLEVLPMSFSSEELGIKEWRFLMGAVGNNALYMKQLNNMMRLLRGNMTLSAITEAVEESEMLSEGQRKTAQSRLVLAQEYIDDSRNLGALLEPGKLIIVDLRDEFIDQDEALGLFVIMLNIFANAKASDGEAFNKFIVFDEAHKYMSNKDLTDSIVTAIREMRHKGVSLMIASQDPPSLPNEIIELSSVLILHRFNSPQWLKHVQKSITQLSRLTSQDLANLAQGEAYLWANKATHPQLTQGAVKVRTRVRITKHGGDTKRV